MKKKVSSCLTIFAIVIVVIAAVAIPLFVNYKIEKDFFSMDGILGYYGALLGAAATIIALVVSVRTAAKEARKAQEHEKRMILADIEKENISLKYENYLETAKQIENVLMLVAFENNSLLQALVSGNGWNNFISEFTSVPGKITILLNVLDDDTGFCSLAGKIYNEMCDTIKQLNNELIECESSRKQINDECEHLTVGNSVALLSTPQQQKQLDDIPKDAVVYSKYKEILKSARDNYSEELKRDYVNCIELLKQARDNKIQSLYEETKSPTHHNR